MLNTNKTTKTTKRGEIVKNLFNLFNQNANAPRSVVVQIAVNKGFNYYTARTQYQVWFALQNETADQ